MLGPVEFVDEVDSTNRVLLDRARDGAPHGLVLVADHQTGGRGRLDRRWEAQPGAALLVSVLLRPELAVDRLHLLTVAAALAAREACAEVAGVSPELKWPNDLLLDRDGVPAKLAGLLAESIVDGERAAAVVIGMGLNLRSAKMPEGAVALDDMTDQRVDRDRLLDCWLHAFGRRLGIWDESTLLADYRAACSTIGKSVRVDLPGRLLQGVAVGVDDDARLELQTPNGSEVVAAGDVVHLRRV